MRIGLDPGTGRHHGVDHRSIQAFVPLGVTRVQMDGARACGDTGDRIPHEFPGRHRHGGVVRLREVPIQGRL